mgnify:CR=1 FL=1
MNKRFFLYYFSVIVSNIGNAATVFVMPLYVLDLTNSVMHLSLVSALQLVPFLIFGIPFGAIVDRANIKRLMQCCDAIRFILYLVLAYVTSIGNNIAIIATIYICSIISGICYVFHSISEATFVPYVVINKDLAKANSLIYAVQYITSFVVPLIGGRAYSLNTVKYFFAFDAITFLISVLILGIIKTEDRNEKHIKINLNFISLIDDVKAGIKCLNENIFLLKLLVIVALSNFVICSYYNCLLEYLRHGLMFSSETIGYIEGVYSLGALIGALSVETLVKKFSKIKIVLICIGLDAVCRLLLPHNNAITFICIMMVIIEFTSAVLNIMVITIRQESIAPEYLGRLNSVYKTVLLGINPIGLVIGGVVISKIGAFNHMIVVSVLCSIIFVIASMLFRERKNK